MSETFSTEAADQTSDALEAKSRTLFSGKELDTLTEVDQVRAKLIDILVKDEKGNFKVPGSTSEKVLLAQLLDGRDKTVMSVAKVRVADKAAESAKDFNAMAAAVLLNHRAPTRKKAEKHQQTLPEDIKPTNVVPGETAIGVRNFTMEEIMQQPE